MNYEAKVANLVKKLQRVKENHPEVSLQNISDHTGVSFSTVARMFGKDSEKYTYRYDTVRPIADMLLALDDLGEGDEDERALKAVIQVKDATIKDLNEKIENLKEKHAAKLEKERDSYDKKIDFLKHQIELKDDRITLLLNALERRNEQYQQLSHQNLDLMSQLLNNKELINKILNKE